MKIAIVGCGNVARTHAKNLKGRCELVFVSRNPESAEKLRRKTGAGNVASFEDILRDSEVRGVVITSPPAEHLSQASAALEAGKYVLVEKPVVVSSAEMDALGRQVARFPNKLMVGENYYYKPSTLKLKAWISEAGPVRRITIRKTLSEETPGWKSEIGALLEGGIHFVALLTELAGSIAQSVQAIFPEGGKPGPERHSVLRVQFENGIEGHLEYSIVTPSITKGIFQHSSIETERRKITFESNGLYALEKKRILPFPVKDLLGYGALMDDFLKWLGEARHTPKASWARIKGDYDIVWKAYSQRGQAI